MKNWARLILVNVLVAVVLVSLAEISARIYWTAKSCIHGACDFAVLRHLAVSDPEISRNYGFSRFDGSLGHVPNEGFDAVIDIPGWRQAKLTIDGRGFRANDNPEPRISGTRTLTLGDSFTFGSQVSNADTWPSCLERNSANKIDNAGVFGYGSAQAVKRGAEILRTSAGGACSRIILSVLVGSDFARDTLAYNYGLPRPAVIRTQAGLAYADIPDRNVPGTKYNPRKPNAAVIAIFQRSLIANRVLTRLNFDPYGDLLSRAHPGAAGKNEIIDWAFEAFSRLPVPERLVVLQYYADLSVKEVLDERKVLLSTLSKFGISYVDTYDVLAGKDATKYWDKHHTPAGNALVCEAILVKFR